MAPLRCVPCREWCAYILVCLSCFAHMHMAQYTYVINPASYLDVIHPPSGSSSLNMTDRLRQQLQESGDTAAGPSSTHSGSRMLLAPARYSPPYTICVSDWLPMVTCKTESAQEEFTGYQVELFRMLAQDVGWKDGDFVFKCMQYTEMLDDIHDPAGNCSLAAAGVEVSLENLASGLKFSWPTYKSGLRVMIHAELQHGSTWAFSEVFHWTVWLSLGGTAVVVGLLVAFLEWITPQKAEIKKGWQSWLWYSLAKLVHVISHVGDPAADASRILMLGYGFLVLVMVSMYTATSASRITAEKLVHPVHGKKDLVGRPVETWSRYTNALKRHHDIDATGRAWENEQDKASMVDDLRAGKYEALVLDAPVLEYTVGTNEACDLFIVGEPFETFSLALAFPADFDDALVFSFSSSIVRLQTYQGALDMLENVYVKTGGTSKCFSSDSGGHGSGKMIQLYQVSGLWYILCITIGLCFVMTFIHNVRKDPNKMQALKKIATRKVSEVSAAGIAANAAAVGDGSSSGGNSPAGGGRHCVSSPSPLGGTAAGQTHTESAGGFKAFLGVTSFAYRGDDESEDEGGSLPGSPKRKPGGAKHHSRFSAAGGQPGPGL